MTSSLVGLVDMAALQVAVGQPQQENIQILAQAVDRCMTTYAVRLTHTDATDDAIFTEATHGCESLNDRLKTSVQAQASAPKAAEFIAMMNAQAKPNFLKLIARIRSDRAARGDK